MAKINGEGFYSKCFKLHGDIVKSEIVDDSFDGADGKKVEIAHIEIRVLDDEADDLIVLIDKDIGNLDKYKKGTTGTFTLRMDFSKTYKNDSIFGAGKYYCSMFVADFEKDE